MYLIVRILKFVFRFGAWMLSLLSGIVVVFLAGYWLGWKITPLDPNVPEPAAQIATTAPTSDSVPSLRTTKVKTESTQHREKIASLLVSENGERLDHTHLQARIATFDLNDVRAALATLETAPATRTFVELRQLLFERWASLDPRAAFDYVRASSLKSSESAELFGAVLRRWAFSDPRAALQAWRELGLSAASEDRYDLYRSDFHGLTDIFSRLGRQDLNQALAETRTLLPDQQTIAWQALAELAGRDECRDGLFAAIIALPSGQIRSEALARAVDSWRRTGHQDEALQWLDSAALERSEKSAIETQMAMSDFFGGESKTAADWLVARAQSADERSKRQEVIVMNWALQDPVACGDWLISQGLDETASRAMAVYAQAVSSGHPSEAVAWARSIQDEAVRKRALTEVEKRIRQFHPHQADALLAPLQ